MELLRRQKMEAFILNEISTLVRRDLRDPRVPLVTFTKAELTPDASYATIYFLILGQSDDDSPENKEKTIECTEGLKSSAGFLRSQLKKALQTKMIPELIFKPDLGFKNTYLVNELLKKIK